MSSAGSTYAVVIGFSNIDICGKPYAPLIRSDSNPGRITFTPGGVGRNIAQNLSQLGVDVKMLTVLGDDIGAMQLEQSCRDSGIDLSYARRLKNTSSSFYLYITDENGEMEAAISDMEICKSLTPEYLEQNKALLNGAAVIVADANLSADTLCRIAHEFTPPLIVDTVSASKAAKISGALDGTDTIKLNRIEAEMLTGLSIASDADAEAAVLWILGRGAKRVFLTMGADGVLCAEKGNTVRLPTMIKSIVSTTGCGDAFTAAAAYARIMGYDLKQSGLAGSAAAAVTAMSPFTVSPELNIDTLNRIINTIE